MPNRPALNADRSSADGVNASAKDLLLRKVLLFPPSLRSSIQHTKLDSRRKRALQTRRRNCKTSGTKPRSSTSKFSDYGKMRAAANLDIVISTLRHEELPFIIIGWMSQDS